jgi:hypothetical protein
MNRSRRIPRPEIGRAGVRKLLQRNGILDESMAALPTDPAEVVQLLGRRGMTSGRYEA